MRGGPVGLLLAGATLTACDASSVSSGEASAAPNERGEMIAYLVDNPDILEEAVTAYHQSTRKDVVRANRERIETPFGSAWAGAENGDVVLVEFFDYACPYCARANADVQRLLADDPNLKVVWRDMPLLGPNSRKAAEVSLAAAQEGSYRAFHDAMFADEQRMSDEKIREVAQDVGLDAALADTARDDAEVRREIDVNLALARLLSTQGTPTYVVGDEVIDGAVGYDKLKAAIARARQ